MKTHRKMKRCRFCGEWFRPVVNNGWHQECCPEGACRQRAAARRSKRYRTNHKHETKYRAAAKSRQQKYRERKKDSRTAALSSCAPSVCAPATAADTQGRLYATVLGLVMATHETIERREVLEALDRYAAQGLALLGDRAWREGAENKVGGGDARNVTFAPSGKGAKTSRNVTLAPSQDTSL